MSSLLSNLSNWFELLPEKLGKHKWIVWITVLILTLVSGAGLSRIKIDMSMDVFFSKDDPALLAYDYFRSEFGSDQSVYLVYQPKDGKVFSQQSLQAVKELQDEIANYRLNLKPGETSMLDYITEVTSIVNVSYLEVKGDSLYSRNFIGDNIPKSPEESDRLKQQALKHPDYPQMYISKNGDYAAILIKTTLNATPLKDTELNEDAAEQVDPFDDEMEFDEDSMEISQVSKTAEKALPQKYKQSDMEEYSLFMSDLDKIIFQDKYTKHLTFYPVGNPVFNSFIQKVMMPEMEMMFGGLFLIIFILLLVLFRSFSAVLWPMVIIILSTVWTLGLIGWTGIVMTMMVQLIIILNLVVGIADAVHIMSGYIYYRKQEYDHKTSLRMVFKKSALACLLTSITTSIGLLSLIFVPIPPIASFGAFAAIGVFLAFVLTVFWLPVAMDLWSPISKKTANKQKADIGKRHLIQSFIRKVEPLTYSYPKSITIIFTILVIVFGYGMTKVRIDSNIVEIVKEGTSLRTAYEMVDKVLGGTQNMEILLDTGSENGMKDPAIMNAIESLQIYIEEKHGKFVIKTGSIVNVTKNAYKALNEDKQSYHKIPQDQPVLEQTLFMFNNANPSDKRQLVSDNYQKARITLSLKNAGSSEYVEMFEDIKKQMDISFQSAKTSYPNLDITITGGLALMMEMVDYISWSQIQSFGLALVVISILLLVVMGSIRVGLIAIVPNIFPVIITFGTMGLLDIPLDADTLIMAPIIIGIAVDDTIHFLTHYRAEVIATNDIKHSIVETFREAGQAIIFTSIILSIGFLVMIISSHQGMSNLGILTSLALTCALLADFLLLPALCILTKANFSRLTGKDAQRS